MNSHEAFDRRAMFAAHRDFAKQQANPLASPRPPLRNRAPGEPIKLGYISADFRSHSVSFFIEKVLANHDRSRFEITCYSSVMRPDAMTQRLRGYAHHWREIAHLPDEQVADLVRRDNLDILVELGGHTDGNRLLVMARRLAPIQVTYLGFPNTTGLEQIDYLITDAQLAPDGTDEFYSEKLVRLPGSFFCYFGPELGIPISPPPVEKNGHITFGLLTNWVKVRPAMMNLWAQLLHAVPNSRIILKAKSLRDANLARQVQDFFTSAGIEPQRIQAQSWTDFPTYLRLMADIDIGLDTFPFNGHTTSCHQLWMGVPVVTLAGETQASLMGKSILNSLKLPELIAQSPQQYLQIATDLARDVPRLRELRASMRSRWHASGLLDGFRFTRELEAAYEQMCSLPM
jgi:protein O-GlcNAc transferase